MTFEITLAVLLAALLHASWNAMIKGGSDVLLDTASIVAGAGLLALPFLLIVPVPNAASWPYIFASITTHLAYYFLMVNAYRTGELSLVYPLMRGVAPLITAVLGILWLRELPAPISWLGMLMISIGVIALALRPVGNAPLLAGHGRAVGFALANAAVIAVYTIIDGTGARLAGNPWSYIVWLCRARCDPFFDLHAGDATTDVLHGVGRTALARIDRRRLIGRRVCDIGVGDDEGPGGTGRIAERNIGPVRHADRRTLVEGTIDCAPLGRRRRGRNRRCGVEGGLMPPVLHRFSSLRSSRLLVCAFGDEAIEPARSIDTD